MSAGLGSPSACSRFAALKTSRAESAFVTAIAIPDNQVRPGRAPHKGGHKATAMTKTCASRQKGAWGSDGLGLASASGGVLCSSVPCQLSEALFGLLSPRRHIE
jgi:hypothetical protein